MKMSRSALRAGPHRSGVVPARRLPALGALLALALAAGPAGAQETARVVGRVVEAGTQSPISGAQVFLTGTSFGTLTGQNGQYLLLNVPRGTYTVRVERIGYKAASQQITVETGPSVTANFQMDQEVLGLDEVVVTGTAGAARKREIGNSVSQINLAEVEEPVVNTDALLQGRTAGVSVLQTGGGAGSGATIRLRGNVSVAMSNQPLIYVDGVRLRSEGYPKNVPPVGYLGRSSNTVASPLNDINPADIERIEIIKGAAATTLYGTEAAAGVIQIFTKRGSTGRAVWTAQMDQGTSKVQSFGLDVPLPPGEQAAGGVTDASHMFLDPWLRDGWRQNYNLSVRGGREDLRYFISGGWENNRGVLPNDVEERTSIRGNFTLTPLPQLQLDVNSSYTNNDIQNTSAGNNAQGVTINAFRRDRNYFGRADREPIDAILDYEIGTAIDRYITGATATYTPLSNFSNRFTVGYDQANVELRQLRPYGFIMAPKGIMSNQRWRNTTLTLDYVGTLDLDLTAETRNSFSFGAQSVSTEESSTSGYAEDFPGPGQPTITSGAKRLAFEERMRVINAGFFVQNLLGFRDRYFLTVGARVDGNSAFGENLGLQMYPKASVSYVLSDEAFWNEAWGEWKLRAAYGHAGRAPGAFDAVRTWQPVGWGNAPAFRTLNVGNPDLGPERTAETELGFDASLLQGRLGVDLTYYHAKTTDALFAVSQTPSMGFLGSQLRNVGTLENRGMELTLRSTLVDRQSWGLELGGTLATNRSKVLDLGGAAPFSLGGMGWIVEGQPAPVMRGECVKNPDEIAEPIVEEDCDYGPNYPVTTVGVNSTLRLPLGMSLTARGEYNGGHYVYDYASSTALGRNVRWPTCFDAYTLMDAGRTNELTAMQRAQCIAKNFENGFTIQPADFFKIREITFSTPLPAVVPGTSNTRLVLSGRNIWRWTNEDWPLFDPEQAGSLDEYGTGMNAKVRAVDNNIPAPAIYTLSLRVVF
jgi:TonB-dependent SusC/RagA subfamily outer membrane receptor